MNDSMIELRKTFQAWLQQQVVNLYSYTPEPSHYRKILIYYDNDDEEESSTPLRDIIISELSLCIAITPVLSTEEPKDSLIIKDEHLDTILEKKSDKFIKFSVKNLVLSPSESEYPMVSVICLFVMILELSPILSLMLTTIFPLVMTSHLLMRTFRRKFQKFFEPHSDEEIIFTKIDPHHFNAESNLIESLLNRDNSIISSPKIDSLLEEFSGEFAHINLISPGIDEAGCDPKEEIRLVKKLLYDNSSPRPRKNLILKILML
nr:hypothetical protein [Tanacetum cinerariifolium]